jgi:hypothetical protein
MKRLALLFVAAAMLLPFEAEAQNSDGGYWSRRLVGYSNDGMPRYVRVYCRSDGYCYRPRRYATTTGRRVSIEYALIRDVNRALGWHLPTEGPRTLNGLILEHLEFIPDTNLCMRLGDYLFETLQIKDNMINNVKIQVLGD